MNDTKKYSKKYSYINILYISTLTLSRFVQAIESDRRPVKFYGVLSDIGTLQLFFSSLLFSFIPRDRNGPADALAKACLCNKLISLGFGPI